MQTIATKKSKNKERLILIKILDIVRYSNKYNNSEREMTGRIRVFGKKVFLTKSVL